MRVFLVDDEIATREGIRNSFPWEEYGYSLVGEAPDGEIALQMIIDVKPDLVITDIRMPFMDGLALSREIRETMPWIHIVILSGYSDFAYARQAISLGVEEYLLKPVTSADLKQVLDRIRDKIQEENRRKNSMHSAHARMASGLRFVQDKLLQSILFSSVDSSEADRMKTQMENIGIRIDASCYAVLSIVFRFEEDGEEKAMRALLPLADGSGGRILLCAYSGSVWALVMGSSAEDTENRAYSFASSALYSLEQNGAEDVLITIGESAFSLNSVHESMKSARHIKHVAQGREEAARMKIIGAQEAEDIPSSLQTLDIQPLHEQLQYTSAEDFDRVFQEYAYSLQETEVHADAAHEYIRMEGLMTAARIIRENGGDPDKMLDQQDYETAIRPGSWETVSEAVVNLLREALLFRDSKAPAYGNAAVVRARQFLSQHFTDPNLMLQDAAKAAGMSNSRFSTVFSQETGVSFTNYLLGLRMAKAKELLRATDMRSSQICYAVGYNDRHYFSYIFKKNTGLTPSEYREQNRGTGPEEE